MSSSVLPMFSSESFIASGFTFRSLIHFEFIFVYGVRKCSNFILLQVAVQSSEHHLLKSCHCLIVYSCLLCQKCYPQVHGFISGLSVLLHWSIFLFLCQQHTVLMTAVLQYSMKSRRLIPPIPFLFNTALALWDHLCLHTYCEICSRFVTNTILV